MVSDDPCSKFKALNLVISTNKASFDVVIWQRYSIVLISYLTASCITFFTNKSLKFAGVDELDNLFHEKTGFIEEPSPFCEVEISFYLRAFTFISSPSIRIVEQSFQKIFPGLSSAHSNKAKFQNKIIAKLQNIAKS